MYTCFEGTFRCIKCGTDSETYIQTYLFKTDGFNAGHHYLVGASEIIDGLNEFAHFIPGMDKRPFS